MGEWVGDPLIPGSDWTRIRVFPASIRSAKEQITQQLFLGHVHTCLYASTYTYSCCYTLILHIIGNDV